MNAGARVIRDEAKIKAPVVTGRLKRAIYTKYIRELSDPWKATYYVGVRKGKRYVRLNAKRDMDAYYAKFVEYGHFTRRAGSKFAKIGYRKSNVGQVNNELLASEVQTGAVRWVPAQPFMRPAWDAKQDAALEALKSYMQKRIPAEVAKSKR